MTGTARASFGPRSSPSILLAVYYWHRQASGNPLPGMARKGDGAGRQRPSKFSVDAQRKQQISPVVKQAGVAEGAPASAGVRQKVTDDHLL
jgi:hypothetical protein